MKNDEVNYENQIQNDFINHCISFGRAWENDNVNLANKYFDRLTELFNELKNENNFSILRTLIDHINDYVSLHASILLLDVYMVEAKNRLNSIANQKIGYVSLTAKLAIKEWDKKHLKN